MSDSLKITLKTLTPLWTGGVDQTCDRLRETSLIGSLRWWYEALVRGLGGYACDPTSKDRCPDEDGKHCVVCEFFGCTGWARKFRLRVLDTEQQLVRDLVPRDTQFVLEFVELRPVLEEEWSLLDCTVRLAAGYGALGGKTVFKPSDEPAQNNKLHHKDYGLVEYLQGNRTRSKMLEELKSYITLPNWRSGSHIYRDDQGNEHDYSWASLRNFWCVKGQYLARQSKNSSTFNQVVGRKQPKNRAQGLDKDSEVNRWLAGNQQASKKIFSFKSLGESGRTFGFVKPGLIDFDEMKNRLKRAWKEFDPDKEFLTGEQILRELCSVTGGS